MNRLIKTISKPSVQYAILLGLLFGFLIIQIGTFHKKYLQPFRKVFMYNLYYHSQWVDPESKQSIGDDGLYQVAGDQLVQKHNFFEINPEVPPLGKYFYGISIMLLGNAEKGALILFFVNILLFFFVSKIFIQDKIFLALAMIFFITDPLIFSHSHISLLDLPQLVFLLCHILSIRLIVSTDKKLIIIPPLIAGTTLGFFMSIKFGFLGLIVLFADMFILLFRKKFGSIISITIFAFLAYILVYSMFFVQGHSLIELLRAQKWMLNFYLSSQVEQTYGIVFSTLLFGKIIGWGNEISWSNVSEWSIMWSIYTVSFFIAFIRFIINKKYFQMTPYSYLMTLIAGLLLSYFYIPFFTRYLVLVIPLLIIVFFNLLEKFSNVRTSVLICTIVLFIIHYGMFWY